MNYNSFKLYFLNNSNSIKKVHLYNNSFSDNNTTNINSEYEIETHDLNIYNDDTIENVLYKMCSVLDDKNINNYYFFYKNKKKLNLTNKSFTKEELNILLINLNIYDVTLPDKDVYSINEVKEYISYDKEYIIDRPLNYSIDLNKHVINPLLNNYNYYDSKIKLKLSNLIFEEETILDNIIYCVHIEDFFGFVNDNPLLSIKNTINIYYVTLNNKELFTLDEITNNSRESIEKLFEKYDKYNKLVDLHNSFFVNNYEIIKNLNSKLYLDNIEFIYYTNEEILFPLEVFFKKINCTLQIPIIKYNPGFKIENIYKLYSSKKDIYGNKIPEISKKQAKYFKENMKKNKSISLNIIFDTKVEVLIDIDEFGNILCSLKKLNYNYTEIDKLNNYCKKIIDTIIKYFITLFDPTSSIYKYFNNLLQDNIKILDLNYTFDYGIIKKINIDSYKYFPGILSFNKIDDKINKLNYKRVSSYNKMNDIDTLITQLFKKQTDIKYIIDKCAMDFYQNDYEQASEYIMNFLSKIQIEDHLKNSEQSVRSIKIENNPGINIDLVNNNKYIYLKISNIDNLLYINYFNVYFFNYVSILLNYFTIDGVDDYFKIISKEKITNTDIEISKTIEKNYPLSSKLKPVLLNSSSNEYSSNNDENIIDYESSSNNEKLLNNNSIKNKNEGLNITSLSSAKSIEYNSNGNPIGQEERKKSYISSDEEIKNDVKIYNESQEKGNIEKDTNEAVVEVDGETDDEAEPEVEIETDNDEEAEPEVDLETDNDEEAEPEVDLETDNEEEAAPDVDVETDNEEEAAPDVDVETDHEEEAAPDVDVETDNEREASPDLNSESNNEPEVEVNTTAKSVNNEENQENRGQNDFYLSSSNNEESSSNEQSGGSDMFKLTYPNPFQNKLHKLQPLLFKVDKKSKYKAYSRMCPWTDRRQPIILTQEEKDYIDKNYPGTYDDIIQYSTNPLDKKYYYICPNYWNLKENVPVKDEDVDKSKLIHPKDDETDLNKKYIFQFTKDHGKKIPKKIPGFLQKGTKINEHGFYVPCCFGLKDGESQKKMIKDAEEQLQKMEESGLENQDEIIEFVKKGDKKTKVVKEIQTFYILDQYKFPIPQDRYGLLPITLQKFFGQVGNKCNNNESCLMRVGVEFNTKKSFLSCLTYLFYTKEELQMLSKKNISYVDSIIERIKERINIDNILQYHNANIPKLFYNEKELSNVNLDNYKDYEIYKKLIGLTKNDKQLRIIINGYENFIKFIEDPNENITYYYLWDIVCSGILNSNNLNNQINMIIIKENNDDITNNISIICPVASYSKYLFNSTKKCIILYNKNDIFEPIITNLSVKIGKVEKMQINKFIDIGESNFLYNTLMRINENLLNSCSSEFNNELYEFKENIDIHELLLNNEALLKNYNILHQVINYDNKSIGLYLDLKGTHFFVPLKPSSIFEGIDYKLINDTIWNSYRNTKEMLSKLSNDTNGLIKCSPKFKVIDNEYVVGILTLSNQFVKINDVESPINDGLPIKYDYNLIDVEKEIYENSHEIDKERNKLIHFMKLEKKFYNNYINTIKYVIFKENDNSIKDIIENDTDYNMKQKFEEIYKKIEEITNNYVEFINFEDEQSLLDLFDINLCFIQDDSNYCKIVGENNILLIPENNLYNGEDNKLKYISSLVHDILLNENVKKQFINDSHNIINLDKNYSISENEIILLEKKLLDYYNNLQYPQSDYVLQNVYENIQPHDIMTMLDYKMYKNVDDLRPITNTKIKYNDNYTPLEEEEKNDPLIMPPLAAAAEEEEQVSQNNNARNATQDIASVAEEEPPQNNNTRNATQNGIAAAEEEQVSQNNNARNATQNGVAAAEEEQVSQNNNARNATQNVASVAEEEPPQNNGARNAIQNVAAAAEEENGIDSESDNESDNEEKNNDKMKVVLDDYENIKGSIEKSIISQYNIKNIESKSLQAEERNLRAENNSSYHEIELSKSLSNNQIINLPKKTDKIKIKLKKDKAKEKEDNKLIVNMNTETLEHKISFYKKINFDKCIEIKYLTKIWRNNFPEKTIFFSFNSMFKNCNYNLLMYILRSYNKNYNDINNNKIKEMLIKYYEKYANPKYYNNIHKIWKNQNKGSYNLIDSTIENIIKDENYRITAIDILLIADNLKIPIVIFYESKNNIKLVNFVENNKNKIYYFIKSASRYDKLYLTSCKKSLRFPFDSLKQKLQNALVNKTYIDFEDYLMSNN